MISFVSGATFLGARRAFHLQLLLGKKSDIKHRPRKSNYQNKRPHFHAPAQSFDEQKRTLDPKMTSLLLSIIFYRESKGKLHDLNCNVNAISICDAWINSALDFIAFDGRPHFWRRLAGWQKFKGIAAEELFDRSGGFGSLI